MTTSPLPSQTTPQDCHPQTPSQAVVPSASTSELNDQTSSPVQEIVGNLGRGHREKRPQADIRIM